MVDRSLSARSRSSDGAVEITLKEGGTAAVVGGVQGRHGVGSDACVYLQSICEHAAKCQRTVTRKRMIPAAEKCRLSAPSVSVQPNTASSICLSGSTQGEGKASPHGKEAIEGNSNISMLLIIVEGLLDHCFGLDISEMRMQVRRRCWSLL